MLDVARKRTPPVDVAIDLGTANLRIAVRGRGIVFDQPAAVATRRGVRGDDTVAVGEAAHKMWGRTPPGTEVVRPVRQGVIADFAQAEILLRHALKEAKAGGLLRPRALVAVPGSLQDVDRRAIQEVARQAGARDVVLLSAGLAAAVGADLPVLDPVGSMVVDVGAGRTEVVVVSLGGAVVRRSLPTAGDDMDRAVADHLARTHDLEIAGRTAEALKTRIGCATPPNHGGRMRVRGRDTGSGAPRELDVTTDDLVAALAPVVVTLRQAVVDALADTPPELAADIVDRGILLSGGASALRGLDRVLRGVTELPVLALEHPGRAVITGAARVLDDLALFERLTEGP